MPIGPPTPEQVWEQQISFFSIDTDLIQSEGYNFHVGALHQLPQQLPISIHLRLTEVVMEEIVRHRMRSVTEAVDRLANAVDKLTRLTEIDFGVVNDSFTELNVVEAAAERFRKEVQDYAASCRGGVLAIQSAALASELFKLYFAGLPPFGQSKDKKSEFPDAASLLLLEQHARENNTMGIVASRDEGWSAFAEQSDYLYCVKSIGELTALFAATDEHASAIKAKIVSAVSNPASALRARLDSALDDHISDASWDASELFSGYSRIEPEAYDAQLTNYEIDEDGVKVWPAEGKPARWVIELTAKVSATVDVNVAFFLWDSIDREELPFGTQDFSFPTQVKVDAFLTCNDVQLDTEPQNWDIEIEIARGDYSVGAHEVEQDFSDHD